jgi:CRISPR-associated protein Cas2
MIAGIIAKAVPGPPSRCLGRFLSELVEGVFVGRITPSVAERLWDRIANWLDASAMAMVVTDSSQEQGFSFCTAGASPPEVVDLDAPFLVTTQYSGEMDEGDSTARERAGEWMKETRRRGKTLEILQTNRVQIVVSPHTQGRRHA